MIIVIYIIEMCDQFSMEKKCMDHTFGSCICMLCTGECQHACLVCKYGQMGDLI